MTTRGYTFGPCDQCGREGRTERASLTGEELCPRCIRPDVPPIAGQLNLDGDQAPPSQIGPHDPWPQGFI